MISIIIYDKQTEKSFKFTYSKQKYLKAFSIVGDTDLGVFSDAFEIFNDDLEFFMKDIFKQIEYIDFGYVSYKNFKKYISIYVKNLDKQIIDKRTHLAKSFFPPYTLKEKAKFLRDFFIMELENNFFNKKYFNNKINEFKKDENYCYILNGYEFFYEEFMKIGIINKD